jgi:soluble lytic murein transglycosylase-like protein
VRLSILFLSVLAGPPAPAQDRTEPGSAAAMQESLATQRLSIEKQMRGLNRSAFFQLPPPEPIGPDVAAGLDSSGADCDALPEEQLNPLIDEAAKQESVQAELLRSIIRQESGAHPCAVSPKGAQGLMQLMPSTSREFGAADPFDPKQNIQAGAKLLKQLLTRYEGDVSKALAAYNAGPARVDQSGGIPSIPETMRYVESILLSLPH